MTEKATLPCLPLGHEGSHGILNRYERAREKHFVSLKPEYQSRWRTREIRRNWQVALTTTPRPPPLCDGEGACSLSDRQGSNFEPCVWRAASSASSHIIRRSSSLVYYFPFLDILSSFIATMSYTVSMFCIQFTLLGQHLRR